MHADGNIDGNQERPEALGERISLYPKGDGAIVFVNATGEYLQVNEIGRIVLECLLQGESVEQCVDAIATQYQADRQSIEADVARFLARMKGHVDL